ncbi:MAG: hypothetical protein ACR2LL_13325 [Nitrosopumilus sp.]
MKIAKAIIIIGIIMFGTGILLFYSIESGQTDQGLRVLKNTGTFVGLSGIGFVLAGVLSYLIYKDNPAVENFGT